jgi:hypothetical protein
MKKIAAIILFMSAVLFGKTMHAQVSLQIDIAPPPIPVYEQPYCPIDGYLWTPGYWAYGSDGYYWVPGAWMQPAQVGFLWTPGYWSYTDGYYGWNTGYWGEHVGFYGGVCYGYGYGGEGYGGGRWEGGSFRYNTAVSRVNVTNIHNTYEDRTVITTNANRTSFNGRGGITKEPSENEKVAMKENHIRPTSVQQSHEQTAAKDKNQLASVNKGHPAKAAVSAIKEPGQQNHAATNTPAKQAKNESRPVKQQNNPQQASKPQQHTSPQQAARPQARTNTQPSARPQQNNYQQAARTQAHNNPPQQAERSQPQNNPQPTARQEQPHNNPPQQAARPQQQQPHNNPSPRQGGKR